ncbi:hypothetical protein [Anaerovorax sp. IOR16]|uniref:hypothetical protein n=1 Tax=Anaerovorax sp. IOR16 TaxID=2773458 RepID=UPI0019D1DB6B|nr:hypothetical protein [Anaerovorax sp. IOR16]
MNKQLIGRKITVVVLAMIMVFAMTSMAFATQTTVTLNLEAMEQDEFGDWSRTNLTSSPITISGVSSTATLYDALVQEDTNNTNLAITWKDVQILDPNTWQPTGEIGKAITSITYNGVTYTNRDSYPTPNSYDGESWMYYLGAQSGRPLSTNNYPSEYLSQKIVSETTVQNGATVNNNLLNLSFEHLEFTW